MTVRIAFLGTPDVAVPPLRALAARDDVVVAVVLTNPDRPRGRSRTPRPPPVKVAAEELGIPVLQPEKPREVLDQLVALELDAAAVVAYGALLPSDVLAATRHGFVNLHYSLLPRWRGAAPVQHAIAAGDEVTGISTFVLDPGMDTGPLLLVERVAVGPRESSGELLERLTLLGAPLLGDAVVGLVDGSLTPRPQDGSGATLAPKIEPQDVLVDWSAPARRVADLVRSADPRPGAHTTWRGERCKLWRAHPVEVGADGETDGGSADAGPGDVVAVTGDGPVVACGEGAVLLVELQPMGRARTSGRDFTNGQRPEVGERFGT
jgi:methionyl-tRNA formyltransferase